MTGEPNALGIILITIAITVIIVVTMEWNIHRARTGLVGMNDSAPVERKRNTSNLSVKKLHEEEHIFQPDQHCLLCIEQKRAVAPPPGTKGFAVQPWVAFLAWKEQGTLFVSLRGPDTGGTELTKPIVRWLRSLVLKNAAPHRAFAHPKKCQWKKVSEIVEESPYAFDYLPIHFYSHLKNALEVVGYRHPDDKIRAKAHEGYVDLCTYLHDTPETVEEMTKRLQDEL